MRETSSNNTDGERDEKGKDVAVADRSENIFGTTGSATEFFTKPTYRAYQRETIEEIEAAYEQGYRHVILDAPTGSGKSDIARAFAFQSYSSHIITVQKLLQDQYKRDFHEMFVMKGRGAYQCIKGDGYINQTCAKGPCRLKKQEPCSDCPYRLAKLMAAGAPVVVHNFDSFYYQNTFAGTFSGRKLLIIDEAHNISNKFSEFLSFTINSKNGIIVPELDRLQDYDGFVKKASASYSEEVKELESIHELVGLNTRDLNRMNELNTLIHRMRRYISEREKDDPAEYVFDYSVYGKDTPKVTFRPVFVGDYASRWLFGYGERTLMMSATILDKEMFCRDVGLNPDEAYYIKVPSVFPAKNRPIVKKYAGKMSYKYIDKSLPRVVEIIQEILDKYPDRKGIIQTHSEKIANYLRDNLDDERLTFNKDFENPQDMLEVHKHKPGSFIVASGLREGLDLRGDLSKVQIFCKVPYPSLGDKVVHRRMELSERWYGWMTCLMFVQSLGRSVRSDKERAVTYILDSGFGSFHYANREFIPDYITEAIIE